MKELLLLSILAGISCLKIGPEEYLVKYGYLSSTHTFTDMNEAIRKFQKFAHIPDTGILDDITVTMMQMPRCGVKDFAPNKGHRAKRFVASSSYWLNRTVTFAFENYNSDLGMVKTRQIIKAAFKTWSDVTNLVFKEVPGTKATIMIRFGSGGHQCNYPFDGKGGVLAHAFYPDHGQVHFDEDELFTENTDRGTNLFWVAAHEFGHALGLPHSDVYEALMYPFYKGYKADFQLPLDDTGAIQALYGCKNTAYPPLSIPTDGKPFNGMLMHQWQNAEGEAIHHIQPDVCTYPHNPDRISVLKKFEAPENNGDKTATRIEGYFEAKKTGYHQFELCADHAAKLFVSTSSSPADKREILKVDKPTGRDFGSCPSAYASYFRAGEKYYIEAIHKESSGEDYIKVGVSEPNGQRQLLTDSEMKWALTDTELRVIVCKGRYEALMCPYGHEIEVKKAAYGYSVTSSFYDKVKQLCNKQRSYNRRSDCSAASSEQIVKSWCQGKQQCTLYAHDTVFTDKCSRWDYSVLDVTYKCVMKGTQTPPPVTTAPITIATTKAPSNCKDRSSETNCIDWKSWGHCQYSHVREFYCPKTCGHCMVV